MGLSEYLRKTFLWYDPLPFREVLQSSTNSGTSTAQEEPMILSDGQMAETPEQALDIARKNLHFPSDFLWGTATAAYQIEGNLPNCNWAMFEGEQASRGNLNYEKAGNACDAWNLFESHDLPALQRLKVRMYRFSIEWSRIEPECGCFDEAVIQRYQFWCQQLLAANIQPMITLHHFTEPTWFVSKGGWEVRDNLQYFERFVQCVTKKLAPYCRYWTTLNEPNGYGICGWIAGVHPPGKHDDWFAFLKVIRHLLVAHVMASHAIRSASATTRQDNPIICMALNHVYFLPKDNDENTRDPKQAKQNPLTNIWTWICRLLNRFLSSIVALFLNYVYNVVFLDALFSTRHAGRLPFFPFPFHVVAWLAGWGPDIKALQGSADWIGVNHYYRSYVQFSKARRQRPHTEQQQQASPTDMFIPLPMIGMELQAAAVPNFEKNEMGWDLTPSSMERLLQIFADRYPSTPIIITESGTADASDRQRVRYLASILSILHKLMDTNNNNGNNPKVDIRGFLVWTFMDNFEWAEGYHPKFGLLETDFDTLERKERKQSCDLLRLAFSSSGADAAD